MTLQPIDTFIFEAFTKRFQQVFDAKACAFVNQNDKTEVLQRLQGGKELNYPYAWFEHDTFAASTDTYSSNYLARRGLDIVVDGDTLHRARILPTTFEVTVNFVTNKFTSVEQGSVLAFSRRWLWARRGGFMKFKVNYGRVQFNINTVLSESVTIPKRENVTETEADYTVTTSATIHGFISEPVTGEIGKISHLEVVEQIGSVSPNVAGSQFFPFPKS